MKHCSMEPDTNIRGKRVLPDFYIVGETLEHHTAHTPHTLTHIHTLEHTSLRDKCGFGAELQMDAFVPALAG